MMRALVSADRPVVRIWHPDNPKSARRDTVRKPGRRPHAVEQFNGMLKYATGLEFGEDAPATRVVAPHPAWYCNSTDKSPLTANVQSARGPTTAHSGSSR